MACFLWQLELNSKRIFARGWWTNEDKISKSLGSFDPYEIINEYGLDQKDFYLEVPFGNDGDFSKKAISNRINADLSNNFGNLVQRVSSFIVKNNNSLLKPSKNFTNEDQILIKNFQNQFEKYCEFMNNQQIDKAIKSILELISATNSYIDSEAPCLLKNQIKQEGSIIYSSNIIIKSTFMLYLYYIIQKIFDTFNISSESLTFEKFMNL